LRRHKIVTVVCIQLSKLTHSTYAHGKLLHPLVIAVQPCHFDRSGEISSRASEMNRLYFADNLRWLSDRKEFPDASVDLIYLDPPFNSNADYDMSCREHPGQCDFSKE
jgi:hypothetical protein